MLERKAWNKRTRSPSEEVKMCMLCMDGGLEMPTFEVDGKLYCPIHDEIKHAVRVERKKKRMSNTSLTKINRALAELSEERIISEAKSIMDSAILPKDIPPDQRDGAAKALATCRVAFGLEPLAKEVSIAHFGDKHYQIIIQYNGWQRVARGNAELEGTEISLPDFERMSDDEVIAHDGLICYKCAGSGQRFNADCKFCDGKGKFDITRVIGTKQRMYVISEAKAMKEVGLDYQPSVGYGFWQPGMATPTGRSRLWKAGMNAVRDCIRRRFSLGALSVPYGKGATMSIVDEEEAAELIDPLEEELSDILDQTASVVIEDRVKFFREIVRPLLDGGRYFQFSSEIIRAMQKNNLSYEVDHKDRLWHRLVGVSQGIYPIIVEDREEDLTLDEARLLFIDFLDNGEDLRDEWQKEFGEPLPSTQNALLPIAQVKQLLLGETHADPA